MLLGPSAIGRVPVGAAPEAITAAPPPPPTNIFSPGQLPGGTAIGSIAIGDGPRIVAIPVPPIPPIPPQPPIIDQVGPPPIIYWGRMLRYDQGHGPLTPPV